MRGIGTFGLALGIVNGVIGAGVFVLPANMARDAGSLAPLAFAVCAVAMGAIVVCFAEAGSRVPTSGGSYGFIEAAFGPFFGFVAGMLLWLSSVLAAGGIAAALAQSLGALVPAAAHGLPRALVIVAALGGVAAINLRGVDRAARVFAVATVIKLLPLLLFLIVGVYALLTTVRPPAALPAGAGLGNAVILGVFALSGMETVLGASGEVARPASTVPRAIMMAMLFVVVLYVAVQVICQALLGAGVAVSPAPLADALGRVSQAARLALLAGALMSMLVWLASDSLGAPRVLFALARDRMLPGVLGRLSEGTRVPSVAIVTHASIATVLASWGSFEPLVEASALNVAVLYGLACGAAIVLRRRGVELAGEALRIPAMPVCAAVGVVSMSVLCVVGGWDQIIGLGASLTFIVVLFVLNKSRGLGGWLTPPALPKLSYLLLSPAPPEPRRVARRVLGKANN